MALADSRKRRNSFEEETTRPFKATRRDSGLGGLAINNTIMADVPGIRTWPSSFLEPFNSYYREVISFYYTIIREFDEPYDFPITIRTSTGQPVGNSYARTFLYQEYHHVSKGRDDMDAAAAGYFVLYDINQQMLGDFRQVVSNLGTISRSARRWNGGEGGDSLIGLAIRRSKKAASRVLQLEQDERAFSFTQRSGPTSGGQNQVGVGRAQDGDDVMMGGSF